MHTIQIKLDTVEKVKAFAKSISTFQTNFDLSSGHTVIDAKSIVGIFSLNLSKPILLTIYQDDIDEIMKKIQPFIYHGK